MNNAIVISAGMPLAAAARHRQAHSWGFGFAEPMATAYEAADNLRFAAAQSVPARAHRSAVPVRHRHLTS